MTSNKQTHQRRSVQSLARIRVPLMGFVGQWGRMLAGVSGRLDGFGPFWQVVVFMVAMSFPQATLALSVAMAGVGPLVGIGLILIFGCVNMVTIAALAEAIARDGAFRSNNAFIGRLAGTYLGSAASVMVTLAAGTFVFLGEIASLVGLANTLASFLPVSAPVLAALAFGLNLYRLLRHSLKLSLALNVVLAAVVIGLLLLLATLALTHLQPRNLHGAALAGGRSFQPAILQSAVGVLLTSFYGHLFVGQAARVVLPRDPSSRSLIQGSAAAIGGITVVFCIWLLAGSGAVAPRVLAGTTGTAMVPLAVELGRPARLLGAPIVIVLLGLAAIRCADVLVNLVGERLPPRGGSAMPQARHRHQWRRQVLARRRDQGHHLVATSPVIVAFLVAEWLLLTGTSSFARLLSIAGVLAVPIFTGIVPMLLVIASRRTGTVTPAVVYCWLGHPVVVGCVYLLFLGIIVIHGLLIWQNPLERVAALVVSGVIVMVTVHMVRRGSSSQRTAMGMGTMDAQGGKAWLRARLPANRGRSGQPL